MGDGRMVKESLRVVTSIAEATGAPKVEEGARMIPATLKATSGTPETREGAEDEHCDASKVISLYQVNMAVFPSKPSVRPLCF